MNHVFSGSFRILAVLASFISMDLTFSWDLILNVFNSKFVTSSDKCTWNIIIPRGTKTALHYIFLVVKHQPSTSVFPAFLSLKRKKYWFKSLIWADQVLNLRRITFKAIMLTITQLVWFKFVFFFRYIYSEETTSNNIQMISGQIAPGDFDTYLNSQIETYSTFNLVISAPNVWLFLFNYVD